MRVADVCALRVKVSGHLRGKRHIGDYIACQTQRHCITGNYAPARPPTAMTVSTDRRTVPLSRNIEEFSCSPDEQLSTHFLRHQRSTAACTNSAAVLCDCCRPGACLPLISQSVNPNTSSPHIPPRILLAVWGGGNGTSRRCSSDKSRVVLAPSRRIFHPAESRLLGHRRVCPKRVGRKPGHGSTH